MILVFSCGERKCEFVGYDSHLIPELASIPGDPTNKNWVEPRKLPDIQQKILQIIDLNGDRCSIDELNHQRLVKLWNVIDHGIQTNTPLLWCYKDLCSST